MTFSGIKIQVRGHICFCIFYALIMTAAENDIMPNMMGG
jgi:hypothetical protein